MTPETEKSVQFKEWLGFKQLPDWSKARMLGSVAGCLITVCAGIILISAIATIAHFLAASLRLGPYAQDLDGASLRNIGLTLAGIFGAPFVVWRSIIAAQQAQTAAEALFNDKISNAAHDLSARFEVTTLIYEDSKKSVIAEWKDDLVTRVAAIDRLEGLASEREDFTPRISRLLATFIRGNFPCENLTPSEPPFKRRIPRIDLQAAVDALGRIHKVAVRIDASHWRLDLKSCNFDGVRFRSGYFFAADFTGCRFELSDLREGNFCGAIFQNTLLNYAQVWKANMVGAKFDHAIWNLPVPHIGALSQGLNLAEIKGATFIGADLTALNYLGRTENVSATFGTLDTKLSELVLDRRPDIKEWRRASDLIAAQKNDGYSPTPNEAVIIKNLVDSGFQNWSPYKSDDYVTGVNLYNFYEEIGFNKWPYK